MLTTSSFTYDYLPAPVDQTLTAQTMIGDNATSSSGDPEVSLAETSSSAIYGQKQWENVSQGSALDSGWVSFSLTVNASGNGGGSASLAVNGGTPGTLTLNGLGEGVGGVMVLAGTQTNGSAAWNDLDVTFSGPGKTNEEYAAVDGPQVDTTNADNPVAEAGISIAADDGYTSVTVTGSVRFTLPDGSYPNPNDLFADVLIFPTTGVPS